MSNFDRYVNGGDNTSFSGVIFGSNAPLLEVELNEAQEISDRKFKKLSTILGKCIFASSSGGRAVYDKTSSTLTIENCIVFGNGMTAFIPSAQIEVTSPSLVYIRLFEETVTESSTLKEYGYTGGSTINNPIKDNRVGVETTRRRIIKTSVASYSSAPEPIEGSNFVYVRVGSIVEGTEGNTFISNILNKDIISSILENASQLSETSGTASLALSTAQSASNRISDIIAQSGTSDTEVVDARRNGVTGVTNTTLKDRLDNDFYTLWNSVPLIDTTFSDNSKAAPAKDTGDRLSSLETALSGKQSTLIFDETPLQDSQHPVKSNGVFNVMKDTVTSVPNVTGMTDPNKKYLNETDGYLYEYDTTTATWKKKILPIQTEVAEIKEDLSQNRTRIALSNPWEIGTFDLATGAKRDNVYRLRNTQYIGFEFGDARAECNNGLEFTLLAWDENETYIGVYANGSFSKSGGSFVETFDFSNFKNYHFMPLLKRKDSSAVETTDGLNFSLVRYTDQTLSQIGKNADAKITGDKIRAIEERIEAVGDGLNDNVKDALLTIISNIAYIHANGQAYYNMLRDALYPSQEYGYKYIPSNVVTGAYINETGNIVTAGDRSGYYDDFINISYAKELTILYTAPSVNNANFRVSIYDSGLNFVRQIHYDVFNQSFGIVTINFDENEKFIKLGWYSEGTSIDPLSDIAFYLSSAADEMIMDIGSISVTTGEEGSDSRRLRSTFIPEKNNLTVIGYPFGTLSSGFGWAARCYDTSCALIGSVPDGKLQSKKAVFNTTLPEGTAFIRFVYQESNNAHTQGWSENIVEDFWVNGHRYRFEEE